jgi:hypothetical protein
MRTSLAHCGCDGALRDDYADRMELDHLVIAVVDTAVAAESRFGSWVAAAAADGPHLIGAVMRDANFDGVCRRLSLEPMAAQRRLPGGEIVRWRLAGVESMIDRGLPAFIDWTDADPRFTSGTGSVEVLELGGGPLTQTWLGTDVAGVRVVDGPAGPRRAVVRRSQAIAELAG